MLRIESKKKDIISEIEALLTNYMPISYPETLNQYISGNQ